MQTTIETADKRMTVYLSGELDHHHAPTVRDKIDETAACFRPEKTVLDFGGVTFMDSSGIGLVMGRYKLLESMGCTLEIQNLSDHAYKVMRLAGLDKIATLARKGKKEEKNRETTE